MKYLALFLSLLCSMSPLLAQDVVEEWECVEFVLIIPNWNNILATARIFEDRESGSIDVAGVTHSTHFRVAGFERRWNFGSDNDDSGFGYSLIIKPDGTAGYYDFTSSDTADPDMLLTCREKNTGENSNLNEDMGNDYAETFITDSKTKRQCERAVHREMVSKGIFLDDTLSAPEKIIREKTMIEECIRAVKTHTQ